MAASRRLFSTLAKVAIGLALVAWLASRSPLHELEAAFRSLRAGTIALGATLYAASMVIAGLRWRLLFAAYGARDQYSMLRLVSIYMTGLFYNTFLPGAVGGDVLRAHTVRSAFPTPQASYAAVLLERVFGLAALACLSAVGLLLGLSGRGGDLVPYLVISGLAISVTLVAALKAPAMARPLAEVWHGRGKIGSLLDLLAKAPDLRRPGLLVPVMGLSFGTQLVGVVVTWLVTRDLWPSSTFVDALVVVPLANIAAYFPATLGGLGARDATFVALFARVGVAEPQALACSLVIFGMVAGLALAGGLLQVVRPQPPDAELPDARRPPNEA